MTYTAEMHGLYKPFLCVCTTNIFFSGATTTIGGCILHPSSGL